jgi:hypothetical protein
LWLPVRVLYGWKCGTADLFPVAPVTTLSFRRPLSVTTFNFSETKTSCNPPTCEMENMQQLLHHTGNSFSLPSNPTTDSHRKTVPSGIKLFHDAQNSAAE